MDNQVTDMLQKFTLPPDDITPRSNNGCTGTEDCSRQPGGQLVPHMQNCYLRGHFHGPSLLWGLFI